MSTPFRDTRRTVISTQNVINSPQIKTIALNSNTARTTSVTSTSTVCTSLRVPGGSVDDVLTNDGTGNATWQSPQTPAVPVQNVLTTSATITLESNQSGSIIQVVPTSDGHVTINLPVSPPDGTYFKVLIPSSTNATDITISANGGQLNVTNCLLNNGDNTITISNTGNEDAEYLDFSTSRSQYVTFVYLATEQMWINLGLNVRLLS